MGLHAAVRIFSLASRVMGITNEQMALGLRDLVRRQITYIRTRCARNAFGKSAIENMATVRNFEVIFDKLYVCSTINT
jgi:hypothetical protein